jgi:phospholipase/carboxylesterase
VDGSVLDPLDPLDSPVVTEGPAPSRARATAVLLHGRGRRAGEMLDLARQLALPDVAWVAIPARGQSWYPASFLAELADNQPSLDRAVLRIRTVVDGLHAGGVPAGRIAFVGFSQGACLAAHFVHRHPARWGGLVALTGGLIGPPGAELLPRGELGGMPAFLSVSEQDAWVPLERVLQTAAVLGAMGATVRTRVRPGSEHVIDADEIQATRALLAGLRAADAF